MSAVPKAALYGVLAALGAGEVLWAGFNARVPPALALVVGGMLALAIVRRA